VSKCESVKVSDEDLNILGYDPGGKNANGIALIEISNSVVVDVRLKTCNYVDEVIEWILGDQKIVQLHGVGIDAFLSWSTGEAGWRSMDNLLKDTYKSEFNRITSNDVSKTRKISNSVLSSNSTFGAMAVQGMALAIRLRAIFPNIIINETHPKVLYHAMRSCEKIHDYSNDKTDMDNWLTGKLGIKKSIGCKNDHEWDALISAWATWKGMSGCWKTDLMDDGEMQDNLIFPAGDVKYYWPCRI